MSMQPSSSKVIMSSTEKQKTALATDNIIYPVIAGVGFFF